MTEKEKFLKDVTILVDTREQKNSHIVEYLNKFNINHAPTKLDFADYSFMVGNVDFRNCCVVERKASVNEIWSNITKERERFEKELATSKAIIGKTTLILEECSGWEDLKAHKVPSWEMVHQNRQVENIGEVVYNTLKSYSCYNRYNLEVIFSEQSKTASRLLEVFYWYYHNYKNLIKPIRKGA